MGLTISFNNQYNLHLAPMLVGQPEELMSDWRIGLRKLQPWQHTNVEPGVSGRLLTASFDEHTHECERTLGVICLTGGCASGVSQIANCGVGSDFDLARHQSRSAQAWHKQVCTFSNDPPAEIM